jgi:colicin import membrane protein
MTSTSPGSMGLSALLHGAVIALVLFFSYASENLVKNDPKVFELVAGEGDNYMATEAPALGTPNPISVKSTVTPYVPEPTPQPAAAEPVPQQAPIQAAPEAKPKPSQKPVDLVKSLERTEERRRARMEAKYKKEQEAEKKRELAEAKKAAHLDAEGIAKGVIGGSTANKTGGAGGKALTAEEGRELDRYFALLKARIKENHVPPDGITSSNLEAVVRFVVAADGSISNVHIVNSSGNGEFDRSVVEACSHTRSIGPRPDHATDEEDLVFKLHEDGG